MRLLVTAFMLLGMATAIHAADELSINAMLVGKQVLEVTDTRQLSLRADGKVTQVSVSPDGRYVVFVAEGKDAVECRLAKISTGKTITIMSRASTDEQKPASNEAWSLEDTPRIVWSPDSSLFAVTANHVTWKAGKRTMELRIAIFSSTGSFKKDIPCCSAVEAAEAYVVMDNLVFTPDSRGVVTSVTVVSSVDSPTPAPSPNLQKIDIATGAVRDIYDGAKAVLRVVGWTEDGGLLLQVHGKDVRELRKISLQGGSDQVFAQSRPLLEEWSPDGSFAATVGRGITIWDRLNNTKTKLTDDYSCVAGWAPNGKMLMYTKSESIFSPDKSRRRNFQSLWLSTPQPGKLGQLCVAQDVGDAVSCSRDCRRIAYASNDQLYVAELTLREPEIAEKLAAGIPLDEEETKLALLGNGKQIASAIRMYSADWGDGLPPADSVVEKLRVYAEDTPFCRPGTQENIFKYVDPGATKMTDIQDPSHTVIGELDAGYGWKVEIYADGHVETKQK